MGRKMPQIPTQYAGMGGHRMTTHWAAIRPDGAVEFHDHDPSLEAMQSAVGGYVERIIPPRPLRPLDHMTFLANEDGRAAGLPDNPLASALAGVRLVGTVVIAGQPARGDLTPLPDEVDAFLRQAARAILEVTP